MDIYHITNWNDVSNKFRRENDIALTWDIQTLVHTLWGYIECTYHQLMQTHA